MRRKIVKMSGSSQSKQKNIKDVNAEAIRRSFGVQRNTFTLSRLNILRSFANKTYLPTSGDTALKTSDYSRPKSKV